MKNRKYCGPGKKKDAEFLREDIIRQLTDFEDGLSGISALMKAAAEENPAAKDRQQEDLEFFFRSLTQDLCRKCPGYRICCGSGQAELMAEIASIMEQAELCSHVEGYMASDVFRKNCVYFQSFVEEMSWLFRLVYQNRYWENRFGEIKQVMRRQLKEQVLFLGECRERLKSGEKITGGKRRALRKAFFKNGLFFSGGTEGRDPDGAAEVTVLVRPLMGARKAETVKACLDAFYQKKFYRSRETIWLKPGINRLSFTEENNFHIIFGRKCCSKRGEDVCGDTFSFTNFGKKRAVMLLSDGMGTGERAFEDSRKLIETLEDLLETGISEEFAMEMLQDALLFRGGGEFSTMDAGVLSLQSGALKLLKAGGTATFIRRRDGVERIRAKTLPPGSRIGQRFDVKYRKLYDGDMVIMVSDGMLEFENMPEVPFRMEDLIGNIQTENAQTFAQELMEAVPVSEDGHDDDRTVLVAAVWEKGCRDAG